MSIPALFLSMGLELSLGTWQTGRHSVTNLIAPVVFLIFKIQGSVFRMSLTLNSLCILAGFELKVFMLHFQSIWYCWPGPDLYAPGFFCTLLFRFVNILNTNCTVLLSLGPLSVDFCSRSSVCLSTLWEVLGGGSDKKWMLEETLCLLLYSHLLNSTVWKVER